jgi:hypothetical protein
MGNGGGVRLARQRGRRNNPVVLRSAGGGVAARANTMSAVGRLRRAGGGVMTRIAAGRANVQRMQRRNARPNPRGR